MKTYEDNNGDTVVNGKELIKAIRKSGVSVFGFVNLTKHDGHYMKLEKSYAIWVIEKMMMEFPEIGFKANGNNDIYIN